MWRVLVVLCTTGGGCETAMLPASYQSFEECRAGAARSDRAVRVAVEAWLGGRHPAPAVVTVRCDVPPARA